MTLNLGVTSTERTRQNYDRRPYPGGNLDAVVRKGRSIPSLKWMQAIGRPGQPSPQRVLVAGCGTGAEAFVMRRRLPKAEIVAVDFSPRSIAIAQRFQKSAGSARPITFLVADLTDPNLAQATGGDFDLITCHGVMSYIPQPERALKNFARCLREGGTLYLGVNGEAHPATRLRPWLTRFGLEVEEMQDERRLRKLLGLWDSLHDDGIGEIGHMSASYLASDVCGPHFNNWPIARWRAEAHQGGLEIAGIALLPLALRLTMEAESHRPMFPAGIGEIAELLDQARPASFHQILLRRAAPGALDVVKNGTKPKKGPWSPILWTGLYTVRFTKSEERNKVLAVLSCPTFNLRLDWPLTPRQAEALRALVATGVAPKGWMRSWGSSEAAQRILWLWAGFGIVAMADAEQTPIP